MDRILKGLVVRNDAGQTYFICQRIPLLAKSPANCYTVSMLIGAFPELKSLLLPVSRILYTVLPSLSKLHRPRSARPEIRNPKSRGFTLIEFIMVIVLIGIIAVIAAPRLGNISSIKAGAFREKLRADIRYAQNLAMTRGMRTRVSFTGATRYDVLSSTTSTCSSFVSAMDPATGQPFTVDLTAAPYTGSNITLTLPAMNCLEYNSLGQPFNCTPRLNVCYANASGMTITINAGAAIAGTVVISPQTGAVN